ncbi:hypothetical protein ASF72_06325 [Arthrobacter sp. Leaf141]|nr:hypothetical protein ASF72_06325 [Arthrobacter sp. Leaf141]
MVRSRFFDSTTPAAQGHPFSGTRMQRARQQGVPNLSPSAIFTYVEATMTKGDHMAAKHIPRTPRPAGMPAAAVLMTGTESPQ